MPGSFPPVLGGVFQRSPAVPAPRSGRDHRTPPQPGNRLPRAATAGSTAPQAPGCAPRRGERAPGQSGRRRGKAGQRGRRRDNAGEGGITRRERLRLISAAGSGAVALLSRDRRALAPGRAAALARAAAPEPTWRKVRGESG